MNHAVWPVTQQEAKSMETQSHLAHLRKNTMSAPDDTILKTQEFIDDAQEIIARTNDLIAALNKLTSKNGNYTAEMDPKQLAQHARMQEDMEALVQRYFPSAADSGASKGEEPSAPSSQNNAAVRPGRFRSRI
jgi:hypothetical protein